MWSGFISATLKPTVSGSVFSALHVDPRLEEDCEEDEEEEEEEEEEEIYKKRKREFVIEVKMREGRCM